MRSYFVILILLCVSISSNAQHFKGKVFDKETKEPVPFAQIYFPDLEIGTTTNLNGEFVIEYDLPQVVKITIHSTGYGDYLKEINTTQSKELVVYLKEGHLELDELVVSCHTGTLQKSTITNIENKSMEELSVIQATSLGEALNNIPGVYNNSTGNGISKPVIRGLSGVRVVTYLNELRIENQQWGGDHAMGINELGIGNVEIIKGPASLLYGSDALGGVAYFRDEQFADINTKELTASTRFESNSLKSVNTLGFKYSKNKFRINLYGGYTSAADYKMGNGFSAKNTRFNSQNFKTSMGYNNKNWVLNVRYNFSLSNIGIPGETEDSVVSISSFQTNKQERKIISPAQKVLNSYLLINNKFFFSNSDLNISLGNVINKQMELEELALPPAINLSLISVPYNVRYRYVFSESFNLISGLQGMYQVNKNAADAEEILIPNSDLLDNGVYSILKYDKEKWGVQAGLRFDNRMLQTYQTDDFNPIKANYNSLNYSVGVYKKSKFTELRLNYSSGYRTPHVSELLANGPHNAASRYEIGDVNLKPEFAQQIDLGLELKNEHLSILINPFFNNLTNYIYLNPTDSVIDGYKVFEYTQAAKSIMYGADFGFHFHPHFAHKFHLESSYSYIKTEDEQGNSFPLTPQPRLNTSIRYEFEQKAKIKLKHVSVQHQYYFAQNNVAQFEAPTSAYHLINVGVNLVAGSEEQFTIKLGVNNLLNEAYVSHLSGLKNIGLLNAGQNIYLSLSYQLKEKNK